MVQYAKSRKNPLILLGFLLKTIEVQSPPRRDFNPGGRPPQNVFVKIVFLCIELQNSRQRVRLWPILGI